AILIHGLLSQQVNPSAPAVPDRLTVWTPFRQVGKRRRVVPGAESELAGVSAAAPSTDAKLPCAWLLCGARPVQIRSLRDREHAVALGKYFLRTAGPLHRHPVKHGRAQDKLFDRFDREASADGSIRKNRRAFPAAPRKFGPDRE